jgi:large subunit ribosomal protein L35
VTATGKILRRKAGQSHNLEHKTPKVKRGFSKDVPVAKANLKMVKKLLGKAASK